MLRCVAPAIWTQFWTTLDIIYASLRAGALDSSLNFPLYSGFTNLVQSYEVDTLRDTVLKVRGAAHPLSGSARQPLGWVAHARARVCGFCAPLRQELALFGPNASLPNVMSVMPAFLDNHDTTRQLCTNTDVRVFE